MHGRLLDSLEDTRGLHPISLQPSVQAIRRENATPAGWKFRCETLQGLRRGLIHPAHFVWNFGDAPNSLGFGNSGCVPEIPDEMCLFVAHFFLYPRKSMLQRCLLRKSMNRL